MPLGNRRTSYYLVLVLVTTVALTLVYNVGMGVLENRPQPLYRSLEVVVQSFTTTGYGEDAGWSTPWMNFLMIVMQLTGIGFILAAVDVFAVPWLRDALAPSAPKAVSDVSGHVVVCGHTPRTDTFVTELEARDREYVLVEADEKTASDLYQSDYRVVHGDPESTDTLRDAAVGSALAVVADVSDDANASITLAARDAAPDVRVVTLVEDATLSQYHRAAGADDVLSPRQLLGESLAQQAPTAVTTDFEAGIDVGEDLQLAELTVADESPFSGQTVGESGLRDRFGVNVIGAWVGGDFETPLDPDRRLDPGVRLLVAGEPDRVQRLQNTTASQVRPHGPQDVILAGYGDSGKAAHSALSGSTTDLTVLDVVDGDTVDVVGDARDPDVLGDAGVSDAAALLLTVGDDTTAIFATLIARELNPNVRIVVRANEEADVAKLYRAGADYVQSLATVSGRMLAWTIFEDEEVLAYDERVGVVRIPAEGLAGTTLAAADVRSKTGCTVVAIGREDETVTDFDPASFTFRSGDEIVVAGSDEALTRFEQQFAE